MERARGRLFLIALFVCLIATRLHAGDRSTSTRSGRGVVASDAAPSGNSASSISGVAPKAESLADADSPAGSSDDDDEGTAVATNAGDSGPDGPPRAVGDQDQITMN